MTKDEIIAIAKEAGFSHDKWGFSIGREEVTEELDRFAALVAAKERDAIKALCLELGGTTDFDRSTCLNLADEISARRGE